MSLAPKKVPHLVRKGNRFYFRIRVPQQLVALLGRTEITESLGNISRAQAAAQAKALSARYASEFLTESDRLGLAAEPPTPAPKRIATLEQVTHIARAAARRQLATDDERRMWGMGSEGADHWLSVLSEIDEGVTSAQAQGRGGNIRQRFAADLAAHGLQAPADKPQTRRLMRVWAYEYGKALQTVQGRTRGEPIERPPGRPLPESPGTGEAALRAPDRKPAGALTLRDVFTLWKAAKADRPLKTVQKAQRSVCLFEALTGDPALGALTRAGGSAFKAKLLQGRLSEKSAQDRLEWVQILLNFEVMADGRIPANPWKGLAIEVRQAPTRQEWKDGDVCRLLDHPVFQRYELPATANSGGAAAYWVPLIGAFTGARITEIAQLLVDDVYEEGGQWYFRIEATRPWQKPGNKWSRRRIPVHPELVRLGLADYAMDLRAKAEERLFPALSVSGLNNAGGGISSWFSGLKKAAGLGPRNTFHGRRNTVETKLRRERAGQLHINGYLGQAPERGEQQVDERLQPHDLIETAGKIRYEGLMLPRVYQRP